MQRGYLSGALGSGSEAEGRVGGLDFLLPAIPVFVLYPRVLEVLGS